MSLSSEMRTLINYTTSLYTVPRTLQLFTEAFLC